MQLLKFSCVSQRQFFCRS